MEFNGNLVIDGTLKPIQQDLVDYYCDINLNAMCRVCLEKNQPNVKMFNIFDTIKTRHISSMIMSCASVQILAGDGLPNTICQKCMMKLSIAWQFKHLCENSDTRLRQFYSNSQHLQVTPDLDGFNISLIKQEENLYDNRILPASNIFSANNISANNKTESFCGTTVEPENSISMKLKKLLTNKQKSHKSKEQKIHQCDTCGKTFTRREYLTQHIRIHTGEKPYHCHLCEKRFVNSGHLTTHMRTHTGERPHSCTLCPKTFSTRQELQKHTMVHKGERPFTCKMCGKCFGSSSNLYSHLKHHTGEKNFTCEHCGKAFYTKQELKQHQVVHTGEKAFLCEFCNKRFSQVAHLRRHSKLHKQ